MANHTDQRIENIRRAMVAFHAKHPTSGETRSKMSIAASKRGISQATREKMVESRWGSSLDEREVDRAIKELWLEPA